MSGNKFVILVLVFVKYAGYCPVNFAQCGFLNKFHIYVYIKIMLYRRPINKKLAILTSKAMNKKDNMDFKIETMEKEFLVSRI